ncbi:MAG: hypothetical protein ACM3O9_09115 [Methylocystaceae bacterium]
MVRWLGKVMPHGEWEVTVLSEQKPGMLKSLLDDNCLIEVRAARQ